MNVLQGLIAVPATAIQMELVHLAQLTLSVLAFAPMESVQLVFWTHLAVIQPKYAIMEYVKSALAIHNASPPNLIVVIILDVLLVLQLQIVVALLTAKQVQALVSLLVAHPLSALPTSAIPALARLVLMDKIQCVNQDFAVEEHVSTVPPIRIVLLLTIV